MIHSFNKFINAMKHSAIVAIHKAYEIKTHVVEEEYDAVVRIL